MEVELVGCRAGRGVLDPVIGDVLRTVGHRDRSALAEFERCERAPHRCIVLVGIAAQVIEVGNHGAGTCSINVVLRFLWKADGRELPSCSHSEASF